MGVALTRWRAIESVVNSLEQATTTQKDAVAAARLNLNLMKQTRLLMSLQLASPIAWSLVVIVVVWSMFLFCGFGVLSGANPTTVVVPRAWGLFRRERNLSDNGSNSALYRPFPCFARRY